MKLKNKFYSLLLALCLCFVPVVLSGCVGTGGGGGNGGDGGTGGGSSGGTGEVDPGEPGIDMSQYISGVQTAYIDDSSNAEIVQKYKALGESILQKLDAMYGNDGLQINNDNAIINDITIDGVKWDFANNDTFVDSMGQDVWAWGKTAEQVFSEDNKKLFVQNLFEATLGHNISNSYLESSLKAYATSVDHKGFFYYEADAIAEYILNNVIGSEVVTKDNEKFIDVDSNGTFDYFYTFHSGDSHDPSDREFILNYVKDFDNTNQRADASTKSTAWNKITFGEADFSKWDKVDGKNPVVDGMILTSMLFKDGAYTRDPEHRALSGDWLVDHKMELSDMFIDFVKNPTPSHKYLAQGDYYEVNDVYVEDELYEYLRFSCFKNYVNHVYYIVYDAVEELNWTLDTKATTTKGSINDYGLDTKNGFNTPSRMYKSVTFMANKDISMSGFFMMFELDSSVQSPVTIDVYANYARAVDGEQVITRAKLASVNVKAGEYNIHGTGGADVMIDMTIEESTALGSATEFYPLGIKSFDIKKTGLVLGSYKVAPSENFIGANTNYVDPINDFVELSFVVSGNSQQNVKFKFAFSGIVVE